MKRLKNISANCETIVTYFANTFQNVGLYVCKNCGQKLFLEKSQILPKCQKCGNNSFTKE